MRGHLGVERCVGGGSKHHPCSGPGVHTAGPGEHTAGPGEHTAGPGVYIEQQAASVVGRVSNQASARKGQVVGPSRLRTLRLTLR